MNLLLSFEIIFPLCFYMALGYGARRWFRLTDETVNQMNTLVFQIFLPVMLFKNVYQSDLKMYFNHNLLIYALVGILLTFFSLYFFIPRFIKDRKKCSVVIQGIYRSNYILFGIPVVASIYGEENLGMTAIMAATAIPLFNVFAVFLFESFRGEKPDIKRTLKKVLRNPLIIASVLGLIFLLADIRMPGVVMEVIGGLSGIATPLSLLVLGATFKIQSVRKNRNYLAAAISGRLLFVPLFFLTGGILLGFRNSDLAALMVLFASPVSTTSFTMAHQMGADSELAGQIVIISSVCSILSMFLWIYALLSLQLL